MNLYTNNLTETKQVLDNADINYSISEIEYLSPHLHEVHFKTRKEYTLAKLIGGGCGLSETPVVSGDLSLFNKKITSLPDNLSIGNSLDLYNTNITQLPDNLSVGYSLYLNNTPITELPDNLSIGNSLDLTNTNITRLPDNLTVGDKIYKDF